MLKEIEIENFKCFKEIKLENLKRVNLVFGENNVGKTVLLEAIFLLLSNDSPKNVLTLLRGTPISLPIQPEIWSTLFHELHTSQQIKISGIIEQFELELEIKTNPPYIGTSMHINESHFIVPENSLFLHWKYNNKDLKTWITHNERFLNAGQTSFTIPPPNFPSFSPVEPFIVIPFGELKYPIKKVFFHTSIGRMDVLRISQIFGEIVGKGFKKDILGLLSELDNSIEDIELMSFGGGIIVGIKIGTKFYPINQLGEGFYRMFGLLCILVQRKNGIVLIDEIENGIYHANQGSLWKHILEFSEKLNIQLFITTHSWEFIVNAIENTEDLGNIQGIRLEKTDKQIMPVIIDGEELKEMVDQNYEVR